MSKYVRDKKKIAVTLEHKVCTDYILHLINRMKITSNLFRKVSKPSCICRSKKGTETGFCHFSSIIIRSGHALARGPNLVLNRMTKWFLMISDANSFPFATAVLVKKKFLIHEPRLYTWNEDLAPSSYPSD